jgi:hypothetical protein
MDAAWRQAAEKVLVLVTEVTEVAEGAMNTCTKKYSDQKLGNTLSFGPEMTASSAANTYGMRDEKLCY